MKRQQQQKDSITATADRALRDENPRDTLEAFRKGEDVGHGVDHDCAQCRASRQALASAPPTESKSPDDYEPPGEFDGGQDEYIAPTPTAEDTQAHIDALAAIDAPIVDLRTVAERLGDDSAVGDTEGALDWKRSAQLHDEYGIALGERLDDLLTKAFLKNGLRIGGLRVDADISLDDLDIDDIEIIDDLIEWNPSVGIMVMRGFVPDDKRWHVEVNTGVGRAHVIFADRATAIKLAALSVFDGENGLKMERLFTEWQQQQIAPSAEVRNTKQWTGQTQVSGV